MPQFDEIKPDQVKPAVTEILEKLGTDLLALETSISANPKPQYEDVVEALEKVELFLEYKDNREPLPPPLNLLSIVFNDLPRRVFCCCCQRGLPPPPWAQDAAPHPALQEDETEEGAATGRPVHHGLRVGKLVTRSTNSTFFSRPRFSICYTCFRIFLIFVEMLLLM